MITLRNYRSWIRWTGLIHYLVSVAIFTFVYFYILKAGPRAKIVHWTFAGWLAFFEFFIWWPLTRRWLAEPHEKLEALRKMMPEDPDFAARGREVIDSYVWALLRSFFIVWLAYYGAGIAPALALLFWAGKPWSVVMITSSAFMMCMATFIFSRLFYMGLLLNPVLDPVIPEERFLYRFSTSYRIRLFLAACLIGTISTSLLVLYAMYFIGFNLGTLIFYAYIPIPLSIAFSLIVGLFIWRRTQPVQEFLNAADSPTGAGLPLAHRAFQQATAFPYEANLVWIAMWVVVGSFILYLQVYFARTSPTDAMVMLAGMFITSLGVCLYQMNWFRRIFRNLLRHISANYQDIQISAVRSRLGVRGKLLLTFVGLVFFALTFAYVTSYQQHLAVLRSQYGREAERWVKVAAREIGDAPANPAMLSTEERGRGGYLILARADGSQLLGNEHSPLAPVELEEIQELPADISVWDLGSSRRTVAWSALATGGTLVAVMPWDQELFTPVGFLPNIFFFVALLLVALGSVFYSANEFSQPLQELTESALAISRGHLESPVLFAEPDEIGTLAYQFELMRRSLREKIQDLESANEEIRRAQEQLLERERLATIGQMASGIAHEIRNPLSSVKMNLQILERRFGSSASDSRHFQIAIEEVERLDRIVGDLLLYARPLQLQIQPERVANLFEQVRAAAAAALAARNNALETSVSPADLSIPMDAARLRQVFLNLVLNAAQASPEGTPIRMEASRNTDVVLFSVTDRGPGIDAANMDRIYDPFFTTKVDGTGLGLPNARKIVQAHGGELLVENLPQGGARFTVKLKTAGAAGVQAVSC